MTEIESLLRDGHVGRWCGQCARHRPAEAFTPGAVGGGCAECRRRYARTVPKSERRPLPPRQPDDADPRRCRICLEWKPPGEFPAKSRMDGILRSECRTCCAMNQHLLRLSEDEALRAQRHATIRRCMAMRAFRVPQPRDLVDPQDFIAARKRHGHTQAQAAALAGISVASWSVIERGGRVPPYRWRLERYLAAVEQQGDGSTTDN